MTTIEKFINNVKEVPFTFYTDVVDMAKSLQQRMRNYSDVSTGKMNPKSVSIAKVHARVIDRIKVGDPDRYDALVSFAKEYPNIDLDKQPQALLSILSTLGL